MEEGVGRLTIRGWDGPVLLKGPAGEEEAELGSDEAEGDPDEESVDEFLLFQSVPANPLQVSKL